MYLQTGQAFKWKGQKSDELDLSTPLQEYKETAIGHVPAPGISTKTMHLITLQHMHLCEHQPWQRREAPAKWSRGKAALPRKEKQA